MRAIEHTHFMLNRFPPSYPQSGLSTARYNVSPGVSALGTRASRYATMLDGWHVVGSPGVLAKIDPHQPRPPKPAPLSLKLPPLMPFPNLREKNYE